MIQPSPSEARVIVDHTAVYAQYGQTMLAVQLFEAELAMVAMLSRVKKLDPTKRVPLREEASRSLDQLFHWLWRASASEARREAEKILPEEFAPQIETAIKWRNRLAHRYLREQLSWSSDGRFAEGTYTELVELKKSFETLGRAVHAELEGLIEEMPRDEDGPPPEQIREVLQQAGRDVFTGGRDVDPSHDATES